MVPAGGYKGVGSALLVELMAACLTGATLGKHASPCSGPAGGPPKTGQLFIAMDPAKVSGGAFVQRLEALVEALSAEPGSHLQGSGRRSARALAEGQGVEIDPDVLARARALSS
jgi:(2R)-3-sulfolactate dehydrogenase (NADP+)